MLIANELLPLFIVLVLKECIYLQGLEKLPLIVPPLPPLAIGEVGFLPLN